MIRLDLGYFLRLSAQLARVRFSGVEGQIGQARPVLQEARAWLDSFRNEQMFGMAGFRTAKNHAPNVIALVDVLLEREDTATIQFAEGIGLLTALNTFEAALLSEASIADAYYVLEKDPYSTLALITKGETLFPPDTLKKVPEAGPDLQEAGRCIAYELPTAAAFHIHRATEAVLRRYWSAVTGGSPKPKMRSIGVYLTALKRKNCGDPKTIAALSQMNELHRNPTIHPEDYLNVAEAIALVGLANSVAAAMLKQIPVVEPEQPELRLPIPGAIATEPEHDPIP